MTVANNNNSNNITATQRFFELYFLNTKYLTWGNCRILKCVRQKTGKLENACECMTTHEVKYEDN